MAHRSAADRTRNYRRRQRLGRAVIKVEVDTVHLSAVLVGAGYMSPFAPDDPADLAAPLAQLVADLKVRDLTE